MKAGDADVSPNHRAVRLDDDVACVVLYVGGIAAE